MISRVRPAVVAAAAAARTCSSMPILWHNPDCSKSRAALALLEERGEPFQTREYLRDTPTFTELSKLQKQLGRPPIEWSRTSEMAWLESFDGATIYDDLLPDDDDILRGMARMPIIMERPILACGDRAVVGRPPERILSLLGDDTSSADAAVGAAALVSPIEMAVGAALERGVPSDALKRSLLRMAAEVHMMMPP